VSTFLSREIDDLSFNLRHHSHPSACPGDRFSSIPVNSAAKIFRLFNLGGAVRAASLVRPVPLFFSLCCAVWFPMEQIKIDRQVDR